MARVLVVDDQTSILTMLESILLSNGHAVWLATNPVDAIDKLTNLPFDLLITDIVMPGGVSGFDLIKTIRNDARFAGLPVVMLSGRREKKDIEKGIQVGADDYIVKPIDPDLFMAKINSLLKQKVPNAVNFIDCPLRETFQWDTMNEIARVSEVGITIHSSLSIESGTKFKVKSDFLASMGLGSHQLRVVSCEKAKADHYIIKAHFIGVTEAALQPLRLWIRSNSIKTA